MQTCEDLMRLVLVEDEWIALRGLTETIDWESYGFQLVGYHRNGQECLDALETDAPDAIITDILMPVMGGLELLREIRHRSTDLPVILLSGHEEFRYARQGMQDGAACYILKASIQADLDANLPEIQEKLRLERERARSMSHEHERLDHLVRAEALRQILNGRLDSLDADVQAVLTPTNPPAGPLHLVLLIRISTSGDAATDSETLAEIERLKRSLETARDVECVDTRPLEFAVVMTNEGQDRREFESRLRTLTGRLERSLKEICATRADRGVAVGIGSAGTGLAHLWVSVNEARDATDLQSPQDQVCISGRRSSLLRTPSSLPPADSGKIVYLGDIERITSAILSGDDAAISAQLIEIHGHIDAMPAVSLNGLRGEVEEFIGSLYRRLDQWRPEASLLLTPVHVVFETVSGITTVAVLSKKFDDFIWFVTDCVARIQKTPSIRSILAAVRYIEHHLDENPKLSVVAGHAGISPSHFSVLFKQAIGVTFSEYLTDLRLQRGRTLLRQGLGVRQAGEMVGYTDVRHFRKLFKRRFGVTPGQIE